MNEAVQTEELETEVETTEESTVETTEELDLDQETEEGVETTEGEEEKPKLSRTQNAKQRLRRKLIESEAEKQQLLERTRQQEERLATLEEKIQGVINPPPTRPNRVDFETEEDYEDSLFEWRDTTKSQSQPVKPEPAQKPTDNPLNIAPDVRKNWDDQMEVASDKYDDFEDVLFSIPKEAMSDPMTLAIMESDTAGEIAYFLGNNPDEAARIAKLGMVSQVKEIDKLGNRFKSKATNAPEPVTPVKGADSPVKDISKMSPTEYRDYRRAQMAKRR